MNIQHEVISLIQRANIKDSVGQIKVRSKGRPVIVPDLFSALEANFSGMSTFRIILTRKQNVRVLFSLDNSN